MLSMKPGKHSILENSAGSRFQSQSWRQKTQERILLNLKASLPKAEPMSTYFDRMHFLE